MNVNDCNGRILDSAELLLFKITMEKLISINPYRKPSNYLLKILMNSSKIRNFCMITISLK